MYVSLRCRSDDADCRFLIGDYVSDLSQYCRQTVRSFIHTQLTLQILNVWKPVDRPISAWPLAVCDAATMAPDDLLVVGGSEPYEGRPVQSISASWSPQQAWYAMRDQTADEVRLE